jgi:hypothetical protein
MAACQHMEYSWNFSFSDNVFSRAVNEQRKTAGLKQDGGISASEGNFDFSFSDSVF